MDYSKPGSKDHLPSEIHDHTVHIHPWIIHGIHWNFLNKEWYRLVTFINFPSDFKTSTIMLASTGYAFLVNSQTLICCFCGLQVELLEKIERINEVHKRKSKTCPFIKGIQCNNVPMKKSELSFKEIYSLLLPREKKVEVSKNSNFANSMVDMSSSSAQPTDDGASSVIITNTTDLQESDAQESGYFTDQIHNQSATASSHQSSTQKPNDNRNESDNLAIEQNSSDNNSSNTIEASTVNSNTNQIQSSTVLPPDNSGQSSTVPPPDNSVQSSTAVPPRDNSGQTNNDTSTNADDNSEPMSYDKLGIITARPKRPEYAVYAARKHSYEKWPEDHHIKPADLARAGYFFTGYSDCARCFYCGGGLRNWEPTDNVWIEHARWFPKCAYLLYEVGREFIDAVQEMHKAGPEVEITFEQALKKANGDQSNPLTFKQRMLISDPAVRTLIDNGFEQKAILILAQEMRKTGSDDLLSSEKLYEAALDKNLKQTVSENLESDSVSIRKRKNKRDDETIKVLRNENNELRQQTMCKICLDSEVAVVFLPCGHLASCTECSCALSSCPLCRLGIKGIVRAYLSGEKV